MQVDDITQWLDPPPLKRTSPDTHLNKLEEHTNKTRKMDSTDEYDGTLPPFLRNQSVEGLESEYKHEVDVPLPFCRHISIPNSSAIDDDDSDSSDDDSPIGEWHKNVKIFDKMDVDPKHVIATIVKKGENLLARKSSYDVTGVVLRNPECLTHERKIPEVDCRRYNIDFLTQSPLMAEGIKNIGKNLEKEKPQEKTGFFHKKLLSPKFSRLFKPNTAEVVRNNKETEDKDKSRSKFFVQRPASPSNMGRSYRIRPVDTDKPVYNNDVIKSDIKLANMGKPMTPVFRRHLGEKPDFADGRFSYRDRRSKYDTKTNEDPKFIDLGRNRIKTPVSSVEKVTKLTPLVRSSQISNIAALATVPEKKLDDKDKKVSDKPAVPKRREPGISRSNYVSLANLKIGKGKVNEECRQSAPEPPVERVI